jgi:hypothetical protein
MSDFEKTDFVQKIKANLDEQVQNLDAETSLLLASARRTALNQAPKKSWFTFWFKKEYWLPAGSLALCSLLAVFVLVSPKHQSAVDTDPEQVAIFEMLNNADDLEVVADPDFYLWADETLAEETGNAV